MEQENEMELVLNYVPFENDHLAHRFSKMIFRIWC